MLVMDLPAVRGLTGILIRHDHPHEDGSAHDCDGGCLTRSELQLHNVSRRQLTAV